MMTVRPVGGAKKYLGEEDLTMDAGLTIEKLLENLACSAPDLDARNVLVAVNGADSSALNGRKTVLRDGDVVSIIPVIHGGAQSVTFLLSRRALAMSVSGCALDSLRAAHPGIVIQAVSEKFILNRYHLERILHLSLTSQKNNSMASRKLETDILMRLALTGQISSAIADAGARPGRRCVVIALGPKKSLDSLRRELLPSSHGIFSQDNSAFLKRRFKITKKHLDSARSPHPLEDLLAERAALL